MSSYRQSYNNNDRPYDSRRDDDNNNDRSGSSNSRRPGPSSSKRDRSRSRSPEKNHVVDPQEDERRARMKRLREENDAEEERITALEQASVAQSQMGNSSDPKQSIVAVNLEELEELDEDEQMQRLLGFTGGFGSTKGTKVDDNHNSSATGAAQKNKARKYRQYMNRKGGFNRPLEKMN